MAHLQQDQRSQTPPFLALAPHTAAVVLGGGEVVGTLEDEGGLFTMTTGTGTMIHEIGHQIAHTGRAVDRLYGETVIFETNESLTGETVTIADSRESTTHTSDLLALRNLGQEL